MPHLCKSILDTIMKQHILVAALTASVALPAQAETQWPRFQGTYLQMTNGDLVELPNLRNHPQRDHQSFGSDVLQDLPRVNVWEIEAIVFRSQGRLESDGRLDVALTSLVDKRDDPGNFCSRNCDGELVVSSWYYPLQYFHVEYGAGSAPHNPEQVALYPRAEENPFIATHTGRTGGKLPDDVEVEAVIVKGACCYASWGYIPVFEGEFE